MFASAFLLPALGLVLLITSALGLFGLVVFTGYRFVCYVVGIIWGQGPRREVQHTIEGESEKAGQTVENTARNEAMSMKSR
ncbi:hypothetical protein BC939DRAFT_438189 [Gamsiella multidivaricata]|uniref:uncharacterized protein n=1 Tax=Gamsiella multidivaricata TaxID=101098 RepID=UPI00221E683F|nr:uncharacterized protein BC939DRAFT_438189 [Gamsiella multidivaricata]KAI7831311.1 hypothetical protein BC939DRAFT_438189 [Gamsiella multidivaricata]